jgi:hypothetical protein
MITSHSARREFLQRLGGAAGAAWIGAQWPSVLAAAQHAHQAVKQNSQTYIVLTAAEARELDALTACIIPTDDLPGAREAGVVHFIDQALHTFAKDSVPRYRAGFIELQKLSVQLYPSVPHFSAATEEQQLKIVTALAEKSKPTDLALRASLPSEGGFFDLVRRHTIMGFLVDPEAGGNRDYAGWKVVGRDPDHMFSPPFGFYDKDYPGWQPTNNAASDPNKK